MEPSAHLNESDPILEDDSNKTAKTNQFIPLKRKKPKKEDILKSTHDLIKKTLESDKTDTMFEFTKKEFEQSRQHELKLFQMFLQSQQPSSSDPVQNFYGVQNHQPPSQQPVATLHPPSTIPWSQNQLPVGQAVSSESWGQNQSTLQHFNWENSY